MKDNSPLKNKITRLHVAGFVLTLTGIGLFSYFVYEAGIGEIWNGVSRLGWGFLLIVALYAVKISTRVLAWRLCVEEPHRLSFANGFRAVMMGEALSVMIPLGILISGTSKAVAVRNQLPLVVGLSSVAIENLFYSLATAVLIFCGALVFLFGFENTGSIEIANYMVLIVLFVLTVGGILMVIRQWRFASAMAEWIFLVNQPESKSGFRLFVKRIFSSFISHHSSFIENVRRFEDLIYGFYRRKSNRFLPVILLEIAFHAIGILEVWIILRAVSEVSINFGAAFLLESLNRIILVVFKLIPFLIGVDEAGARFVTEALALGAATGVTLAIIRKGRVIVWVAMGIVLIVRSGLSLASISQESLNESDSAETP